MDNLARKNNGGNETLSFDLSRTTVREMNQYLHHNLDARKTNNIRIIHPDGAHNIAVGLDAPVNVEIEGHSGYFCAGMNKQANVTINGNVGWSIAENIMSGVVRVKGFASESAAASGHGGTVIIERDASLRCGISMKGVDIVVGGSVGNFSAFMAQAGHLVVCGDAGDGLGDSIYEAVIYVRGKIKSLGADARIEPMTEEDHKVLAELLARAGFNYDTKEFKKVASARELYHWNADANQEY
jgi:methylamine---glutamate N-methyltransferase subunit B